MGRYSFFILNFVTSSHRVYATSGTSDSLYGDSSQSSDSLDNYPIGGQSELPSDYVDSQETPNNQSEIQEQIPEVSQSTGNLELQTDLINQYLNDLGTTYDSTPRIQTRDTNDALNPKWFVKSYFTNWSMMPIVTPSNIMYTMDMTYRELRNSFQLVRNSLLVIYQDIGKVNNYAGSIHASLDKNMNAFWGQVNTIKSRLDNVEGRFSNYLTYSWGNTVTGWIGDLKNRATNLEKFKGTQNQWNYDVTNWIADLRNRSTNLEVFRGEQANWNNSATSWIAELKNRATNLEKFKGTQNQWNHDVTNWIGDLRNTTNTHTTDIDILNKKIDSFSWSDTGIIATLLLVKDSLDKFKDNVKDNFYVDDPYALIASEGGFVRMIKAQFILLKNLLKELAVSQVEAITKSMNVTNSNLKKYFDIDDKTSALYKLRYSIVSGFVDLEKILELISADTLALRDSLITSNINLDTILGWLKLLYDKPTANVNVTVPPFDYDRLEDVIRRAMPDMGGGESGWLKQAIKTAGDIVVAGINVLGDVLGKAIDGLAEIATGILDLLKGLLDAVIKLIVPENLNFLDKGFSKIKGKFDVKFNGILDLGTQIQNVFKPVDKDFFTAISFSFMGANFVPDKAVADSFVPKFRMATQVLIWLYVAWWVYKKITGTGDIINDN